jgi:hypothetical protein
MERPMSFCFSGRTRVFASRMILTLAMVQLRGREGGWEGGREGGREGGQEGGSVREGWKDR